MAPKDFSVSGGFWPKFDGCFCYKQRRGHRRTEKDGPLKTEAVTVMQPQIKECWEPPEGGGGKEIPGGGNSIKAPSNQGRMGLVTLEP